MPSPRSRFIASVTALALLLVAWPALAATVDQAITAQRNRDYKQAIVLWTQLIDSGQFSGDRLAIMYYNRGLSHRRTGQLDKAVADYTKAARLTPQDASIFNNRGFAYDEQRKYDLAIADYTRAIQLKPDYARAYSNRGVAYRKKGRDDLAIADYNQAIKIDPQYATPYFNRALVYRKRKMYDRAIADVKRFMELNPRHPLGPRLLAVLQKEKQKKR